MKKFIILFSLWPASLSAQTDVSRYAATITGKALEEKLSVIAGAAMEGRETGTEGQRKAAAYIESQFSALGLLHPASLKSYQQFYPLYRDSLLRTELIINNIPAQYGTDYITQLNANENGSFRSAKIVFAGYGISDTAYNDYAKINVKGKIVVFFLGEPRRGNKFFLSGTGRSSEWSFPGLSKKLALAASKGAVGALIINPSMPAFAARMVDNSKKTNVYYPRTDSIKKLNFATLSHAYAKQLLGDPFDSLLAYAKRSDTFTPVPTDSKAAISFSIQKYRDVINASNVIGIIEGTDKKDEYVFLTGHYDHLGTHDGKIYYGADDDGSGTVGVMQMAAAFAKAKAEGKGPRRTVVFMTVSGEEKGLWGSEYYSDHPIYPINKTSADLNTDMVGRVDTERQTGDTLNYVYVVGHDKLSSDLPVINEAANRNSSNLTLDYRFDDPKDPNRIYFRSDHYNFARKGIPVLFFYDGMLKADYHKPTDTIEKINWDLYAKRVQMIFTTAWDIANRNDMLKRDIPLPETAR